MKTKRLLKLKRKTEFLTKIIHICLYDFFKKFMYCSKQLKSVKTRIYLYKVVIPKFV